MLDSRGRVGPPPVPPGQGAFGARGSRRQGRPFAPEQHHPDRMSDDEHIRKQSSRYPAPIPFARPARRRRRDGGGRRSKPKLRKLRLLSVLLGFTALALISTVFGMMMAVA